MSAGLFVRPPYREEKFANWEKTTAGLNEDGEGWVYVPPVPGVFTVFPGEFALWLCRLASPVPVKRVAYA